MSTHLALGAVAALAGLAALSGRGSPNGRKPWAVLADLSGYPRYDSVPSDLLVLRLPDGQQLRFSSLLDRADGEAGSELGWMLFQFGDGQRAQARLEKLGRWLDSLATPVTLWRGLNIPEGEAVRRTGGAEGNQHWTPSREIALAFAYGSDWGPTMPQRLPQGTRPVLLRVVLRDGGGIDLLTTAYWYLGAIDDPEQEVYLKPWAADRLMREAQIIEDP